jgi:uncharacterized iron-regulated membrane protein
VGLRLHRWAGLLAGLFLSLLGLSGSLLVFRDAIEKRRSGVRAHWDEALPRAGAQRVFEEARQRHPRGRVLIVNLREPLEVVIWEDGASRLLAYDPVSAKEIGPLRRMGSWLTPVARMHGSFLLGARGRHGVGAAALALGLVSVSGLVLFWRRRASWHARAGLAVCLPLLLMAVSGAMLIWAKPAFVPPPRAGAGAGEWRPVEEWTRAAERALPGSRASYVSFPFAAGAAATVRVRLPGDLREQGAHDIHVDPVSGAVLRVDRLEAGPWSRRIYMNLAALHFGEWGGTAGRWIWVALGLSPGFLWISGWLLWRSRGRTRGRKR